jgi:hypothetical protein
MVSTRTEKQLLPPHPNPLPHWGRRNKRRRCLLPPLINLKPGKSLLRNIGPEGDGVKERYGPPVLRSELMALEGLRRRRPALPGDRNKWEADRLLAGTHLIISAPWELRRPPGRALSPRMAGSPPDGNFPGGGPHAKTFLPIWQPGSYPTPKSRLSRRIICPNHLIFLRFQVVRFRPGTAVPSGRRDRRPAFG